MDPVANVRLDRLVEQVAESRGIAARDVPFAFRYVAAFVAGGSCKQVAPPIRWRLLMPFISHIFVRNVSAVYTWVPLTWRDGVASDAVRRVSTMNASSA